MVSKNKNDDILVDNPKKLKCPICGKVKLLRFFYKSKDPRFAMYGDGRCYYCKDCLKDMCYLPNGIPDKDGFKKVLREYLNLPFFDDLYKKALQNEKDTLGSYISQLNIVMKGGNLTWENGETDEKVKQKNDNSEQTISISPELVEKWGKTYNFEEIQKLEQFWNDMKRSYNIEGASHHDYLKKICKISLKMEEAIDNGNIDEFKKLSEAYDKLMHSAKFTAVQKSAADRTGGLNTFSEFFEYIEKEGFIPKFHTNEPMDIVDKTINDLKEYTKRLVLGEPNLATLIDEAIKKINDKEQEDDFEEDVEEDMEIIDDDEFEGDN